MYHTHWCCYSQKVTIILKYPSVTHFLAPIHLCWLRSSRHKAVSFTSFFVNFYFQVGWSTWNHNPASPTSLRGNAYFAHVWVQKGKKQKSISEYLGTFAHISTSQEVPQHVHGRSLDLNKHTFHCYTPLPGVLWLTFPLPLPSGCCSNITSSEMPLLITLPKRFFKSNIHSSLSLFLFIL